MKLGKYIKAAFLNRWNLLGLVGGVGFAAISGQWDVVMPLILAAEFGYLGLLGTHPKFVKYVEAQEAKQHRNARSQSADQSLRRIMQSLPEPSLRRFESLRSRCVELRRIALDLERPGASPVAGGLEQVQLAGLDRLLWIFLKLMYTEYSLSRFFQQTSEERIKKEIDRLQKRIAKIPQPATTPHQQRILETLEDNLETCQHRLENYEKARYNFELVQLEIERLENKIRSLSELAVNRKEPDFISGQVDEVADSMLGTEKTINDLQFATGLQTADDDVPELVQRQPLVIS